MLGFYCVLSCSDHVAFAKVNTDESELIEIYSLTMLKYLLQFKNAIQERDIHFVQ